MRAASLPRTIRQFDTGDGDGRAGDDRTVEGLVDGDTDDSMGDFAGAEVSTGRDNGMDGAKRDDIRMEDGVRSSSL